MAPMVSSRGRRVLGGLRDGRGPGPGRPAVYTPMRPRSDAGVIAIAVEIELGGVISVTTSGRAACARSIGMWGI